MTDVCAENMFQECEGGNTEEVERLLNAGLDVNQQNELGLTPIYFAALRGHTETVKLLIERCIK